MRPVVPYTKHYGPEICDAQEYIGRADHAAWLATVDGRVAGQILVHENWNRLALIWDVAVDPPYRREGIGRRLVLRPSRRRDLPEGMPLGEVGGGSATASRSPG